MPNEGGWAITLDGRGVRTPARAALVVPGRGLATAIVDEWAAQGETIAPTTMPLTGLANATIDQVRPDPARFAAPIAAYATSDLLCYRADVPAPLVERQAALWDQLLAWAAGRYGIRFEVTAGVLPVAQPSATIERLGAVVASIDSWLLVGLSTLVTLTGTLAGSLALLEGATDADRLWAAATVDEAWQAAQWGADAEAEARVALRRAAFDTAWRYCGLVRAG